MNVLHVEAIYLLDTYKERTIDMDWVLAIGLSTATITGAELLSRTIDRKIKLWQSRPKVRAKGMLSRVKELGKNVS